MRDVNPSLSLPPDSPLSDPTGLRHDARAAVGHTTASHTELSLALLSTSDDCVKLLGADGRIDFMSHAGLCAMEVADLADVKGLFWWDLWPAVEEGRLRDAVVRANAGQHTRFEVLCVTLKGTPKWWDTTVAPILHDDGSVLQVLAVSRDVTALYERTERLEQALAEARILRLEVDHRVKNSLAIVSSLLTIQARSIGTPDAADALRGAAARVRTIAAVHDRLYQTNDLRDLRLDEYLRLLCADLASSVGAAVDIRCDADLAQVTVPPDTLVALGLITAELVGNAVRHGGKSGAMGLIRVGLTQAAPDLVVLEVADDGPGLPEGFDPVQSRGIGMQVVLSMVQKIAGQLAHDEADLGGALFRLHFDPAVVS